MVLRRGGGGRSGVGSGVRVRVRVLAKGRASHRRSNAAHDIAERHRTESMQCGATIDRSNAYVRGRGRQQSSAVVQCRSAVSWERRDAALFCTIVGR